MKKYINIFLIVFTFLILFSFKNVSASTINTTLNFDNNDKFNYFYEMEHNTLFYKFLLSHQYDLDSYFASITNLNFDNYKYFVSIMNRNEVTSFGYGDESIPQNYTHVIELFLGPNMSGIFNTSANNTSVYLYNCSKIYRFYYNNNELIYTYSLNNINDISAHYISPIDFDNIQYLISKIYSSNFEIISTYSNTLDVSKIVIDNTTYNFDTGFKGFWNKFKSLVNFEPTILKDYDLEYNILSYYQKNSLSIQNIPIKTLTSLYNNDLDIPANMTTLDVSGASAYLFVPKNVQISNLNRYIYSSSTLTSSITGVSLINMKTDNFYSYDLGKNNSGSNITFMKLTYKKINTAYQIDLEYLLSKYNVDLDSNNYLQYGYYFHSVYPKGKTYLYYNSNAWTVYDLSAGLVSDLEIENPNTNNTITISREDMNTVLSTYDMSGESIPVTDFESLTGESYSDFFSKGLENVSDLVSSLSSVFAFIGTMLSLLFTTFPPIIQQFFEVILVLGGIILIIKLIRGQVYTMALYDLACDILGELPQSAEYLYSILTLLLCILALFVIISPFILLIKIGGK